MIATGGRSVPVLEIPRCVRRWGGASAVFPSRPIRFTAEGSVLSRSEIFFHFPF